MKGNFNGRHACACSGRLAGNILNVIRKRQRWPVLQHLQISQSCSVWMWRGVSVQRPIIISRHRFATAAPELSMDPFYVTQSNPTHQPTDPTKPDPLQAEKFGPDPTRPSTTNSDRFPVPVESAVKSNLTARCNKILSNRALSEVTQSFQIFL